MSISGNLQTMELADLLQWVASGSRTGTLVIESEEVAKRVFFQKGKIVASGSTLESEQLGHFLVSHGFITHEELAKAIAMQEETGMLLGKILVTIGGISEEELLELLVLQTEESVYDLFTWSEADFRFVDNELLNRGMIPLALDVTAITLQGMNRLDEWSRIRKRIPCAEAIPVTLSHLDLDSRTTAEQHVLNGVNDQATIAEICQATRTSEFQVSRLLFGELLGGRLKIVLPRTVETPSPTAQGAPTKQSPEQETSSSDATPDQPVPPVSVDAQLLCNLGIEHLEQSRFEPALRHLHAALVLEPRSSKVKDALAKSEDQIRQKIYAEGLDLEAVPSLERNLEQLTDLQLSPEQGFLLTRIDGSLSINSLLKLSPLNRLDAELVFYRLHQQGHIKLHLP